MVCHRAEAYLGPYDMSVVAFLFVCVFFLKQKIYILIHIRLMRAGR